MIDEPVRGRLPEPSFYSLAGIEQLNALGQGLVLRIPVIHLTGAVSTLVEPGSIHGLFSELGWLQLGDGAVDVRFASALTFEGLAMTVAPPGTKVRAAALSVADLRPLTLKGKTLVVRAHLLQTSAASLLGESVLEDSRGRSVGRAAGRILIEPIDPPPPPARPLAPVEEPIYPTPDPYLRPVDPAELSLGVVDEMGGWLAALTAIAEGGLAHPPICDLFGIRLRTVAEGFAALQMQASEWLLGFYPDELSSGYLATLAHMALSLSAATLAPVGHGLHVLDQSISFLGPAAPDGRHLAARASVIHQRRFLVSSVEVTDADGNQVALGHQTSLFILRERQAVSAGERIFATVLLTDVVGSTVMADRLGDAEWRELLERHNDVVRGELQTFRGREVKTTGDGFLAVFDAPTRAVQCARAIRDGLRRLRLEVRVGLHAGECEAVAGDIAGIAVHVASRVQDLAEPGEILVSSTVRDLVTGSGLRFVDRGRHQLKGLEGEWQLFALDV